jgi:hypothetical protein
MTLAPLKIEASPIPGQLRLTYNCPICHQDVQIDVDKARFEAWQASNYAAFVQDAWPDKSASEREIFITGMHGKCYDDGKTSFGEGLDLPSYGS